MKSMNDHGGLDIQKLLKVMSDILSDRYGARITVKVTPP